MLSNCPHYLHTPLSTMHRLFDGPVLAARPILESQMADAAELLLSLQGLNEQFVEHVRTKLSNNPSSSLETAVKAYLSHVDALEAAFASLENDDSGNAERPIERVQNDNSIHSLHTASHKQPEGGEGNATATALSNGKKENTHEAVDAAQRSKESIGKHNDAKGAQVNSDTNNAIAAAADNDDVQQIDSGQSKLYFLTDDNTWDSHGAGTHYVNELADGGSSIEWKNKAQKTILSSRLYAGLSVMQKESHLLMPLFNAAAGGDTMGSKRTTMLRLRTVDDASNLKALLERRIPAMQR